MSKKFLIPMVCFSFFTSCGQQEETTKTKSFNQSFTADFVARHGMSEASYQRNFDRFTREGFKLRNISAYSEAGKPRFAATWDKSRDGAIVAKHGMSGSQYQREFNRLTDEGYRLTDISGYEDQGKIRFAAKWTKKSGPGWRAHHNLSKAAFWQKVGEYQRQGFKVANISAYNIGQRVYFAAIWEKARDTAQYIELELNFVEAAERYQTPGYHVVDMSGYQGNGASAFDRNQIVMVLDRGEKEQEIYLTQDPQSYQRTFRRMELEGKKPVHVAGYELDRETRYLSIFE